MLTPDETAHAASILDPTPALAPIPPLARPKILIASVIRKPPVVLEAFLKTLLWQTLRAPGADIHYHFILNFGPSERALQDAAKALLAALGPTISLTVEDAGAPDGDYAESAGRTRGWSPTAWHRVGQLKDRLIQRALTGAFDYLWLVDADVLNDPWTLQSLLNTSAPIVSAVYWTNWNRAQPGDAQVQHAGPQVWLRHPYTQSGRGWTEASFRAALIGRERVRVWGLGANTLIRHDALKKGISFAKLADLPPGPMSDGEDRHFCLRADALHIEMYADAWPDVFHAYHPDEYVDIPERLKELSQPRPARARLGDLVSFAVENLEVPNLQPQWVRGQLGKLRLLPELEERLYTLAAGESAVFKAHFPAHWGLDTVRSQNLVLRVTMNDIKTFRLPPVIDEELFAGTLSGALIDHTTLTERQATELGAGATSG